MIKYNCRTARTAEAPEYLKKEHSRRLYVVCADRGTRSGFCGYENEEDRFEAAPKGSHDLEPGKSEEP